MKKIITNGCFDILHEGHIKLLKECHSLSNGEPYEVIVLINSDASVKFLKNHKRPINSISIRKENLLKTGLVHEIKIFDDDSELLKLIQEEKPDFLVKGMDYGYDIIVGAKEVLSWGGKVHLVELVQNYSTTKIVELNSKTIIITGGLGFIGSNMIHFLNKNNITNIYIVDDLKHNSDKWKNVADLNFVDIIDYRNFLETLKNNNIKADYIINLGACSSTSESDLSYLWEANTNFTKQLINVAINNPSTILLHASSAATYGLSDNFKERIDNIIPLNTYGFSKLVSDRLINEFRFNRILSFRFFNVYGPRESYKGKMKSIITKFIEEDLRLKKNFPESIIGKTSFDDSRAFKCYKSYKENILDGEMKRDFIYVEDVCKILFHFMITVKNWHHKSYGIFNVGTGQATSVNKILELINPYRRIEYVDMPEELRPIYQYYTKADITKLINEGQYTFGFTSLEEGIKKTKEFYSNL